MLEASPSANDKSAENPPVYFLRMPRDGLSGLGRATPQARSKLASLFTLDMVMVSMMELHADDDKRTLRVPKRI